MYTATVQMASTPGTMHPMTLRCSIHFLSAAPTAELKRRECTLWSFTNTVSKRGLCHYSWLLVEHYLGKQSLGFFLTQFPINEIHSGSQRIRT